MIATRAGLSRTISGVIVASAAVLALTGCVGTADEPAPTVTVTMAPTPEPAVTVTATPTAEPTSTPPPVEVVPTEEPVAPVETAPQQPDVIPPVDEIVITQPSDLGVRAHATGNVQIDSAGIPYRYTVAEGDIAVEICSRFGRYIWQLGDAGGTVLDNPFLIHAGDTILLMANELPEGYVVPGR
ncbi:MAG: hypothetical protein JWQ43_1432 [Glaciihabitans sp.]|nr:hypothetical protein [Glaciihabitans sp.]